MTKMWAVVILLLAAVVVFALGAFQVEPNSLKNPEFDLYLGLILASTGLAVWAAPA